jgi:hypothetical protein
MRLFLLNLLSFAGHDRQDSGGHGGKMYLRVSRIFLAQGRKGQFNSKPEQPCGELSSPYDATLA